MEKIQGKRPQGEEVESLDVGLDEVDAADSVFGDEGIQPDGLHLGGRFVRGVEG